MSKTATVATLPKFDFGNVFGLQKANYETALQAQKILSETAQAVAKLHADWLKEAVGQAQGLFAASVGKKPEAALADARAAVERALAVARQEFDLGVRAQSEVIGLLTKRAAANFDQVKALAA